MKSRLRPVLHRELIGTEEAAKPPLRKAGFWIRFSAYLVDDLVAGALILVAISLARVAVRLGEAMAGGPEGQADPLLIVAWVGLSVIVSALYQTLFVGWRGQTPGKILFRLKIIRTNGAEMGYGRAFIRWLGRLLSFLLFGMGFLVIAFTKEKQGLHDKIAKTSVIRLGPWPSSRSYTAAPPTASGNSLTSSAAILPRSRLSRHGSSSPFWRRSWARGKMPGHPPSNLIPFLTGGQVAQE
ncbi:MAG: RDD family protein [Candidatus Methylomirabilales bacterium]